MEKLKFTAYTDAKYRSKIGDDYTVLMDPDTLQFGKEIVYREDRQLGAIGGNTRFERYKPENLSFKITVDCTGIIEGTGDNDKVYNKIQELEKLLYIYNSDGHRPSYVLIQYVELLFKGQIKKMDVKYTLFSNSGVPYLCHKIYGDSLLVRQVARFNNLNSFRNIPAGTELLFPPLKKE